MSSYEFAPKCRSRGLRVVAVVEAPLTRFPNPFE